MLVLRQYSGGGEPPGDEFVDLVLSEGLVFVEQLVVKMAEESEGSTSKQVRCAILEGAANSVEKQGLREVYPRNSITYGFRGSTG